MRVQHSSNGCFIGHHKGARIEITREKDGRFYIIVNNLSGGRLYDGWAADHIRRMPDAKIEAIKGAKL